MIATFCRIAIMKRRAGFTLIELLVVISIIGMLMALLLPAVQSARESGRANTCRNNLRQQALAVIQFEQKQGEYPGLVNDLDPDDGIGTPRGWSFMVLPYLERTDLFEAYSAPDSAPPTETLEIMLCPSDPPESTSDLPPGSYVGNSGLDDINPVMPGAPPADWKANGVFLVRQEFHYHPPLQSTTGKPQYYPLPNFRTERQTSPYIGAGDGLTNTLLLTENIDTNTWVLPYTYPAFWERWAGCIWHPDVAPGGGPAPPQYARINEGPGIGTGNNAVVFARPSAYHPGIVNVAFADGRVRTLNQDIDYLAFCLLMTPMGKRAAIGGSFSNPPAPVPAVFRINLLDDNMLR